MINFQDFKKELMKNPMFRKEFENTCVTFEQLHKQVASVIEMSLDEINAEISAASDENKKESV